MSKHTPGPWKKYDSAFPQFFVTTDGKDICKVSSEDVSMLEAEANARLIAAAPDLIEALEKMVEYAHQYSGRERSQSAAMEIVETPISDDVAAARAAIAKARGEA